MDYAAQFQEERKKKKKSVRMQCGFLEPPSKTAAFGEDLEIRETIEIASQFFKAKEDIQNRIQVLEATLDAVERDIGWLESIVKQDENMFSNLVYFDCDIDDLKKWREQLLAELAICKQIYGDKPVTDAKALWMKNYRHILNLNDDGLPF